MLTLVPTADREDRPQLSEAEQGALDLMRTIQPLLRYLSGQALCSWTLFACRITSITCTLVAGIKFLSADLLLSSRQDADFAIRTGPIPSEHFNDMPTLEDQVRFIYNCYYPRSVNNIEYYPNVVEDDAKYVLRIRTLREVELESLDGNGLHDRDFVQGLLALVDLNQEDAWTRSPTGRRGADVKAFREVLGNIETIYDSMTGHGFGQTDDERLLLDAVQRFDSRVTPIGKLWKKLGRLQRILEDFKVPSTVRECDRLGAKPHPYVRGNR